MSKLVKTLFGGESDEGIERQEKSNQLLRDFLARQEAMGRAVVCPALWQPVRSCRSKCNTGFANARRVHASTRPASR